MYSAAFIYEPGQYDADFHRLNERIAEVARSMPGFLGQEAWQSADGKLNNATYYWASLDDLQVFSNHPQHLEAKRQYLRWYTAYHVVIAEVVRCYGNGALPHITSNSRGESV